MLLSAYYSLSALWGSCPAEFSRSGESDLVSHDGRQLRFGYRPLQRWERCATLMAIQMGDRMRWVDELAH